MKITCFSLGQMRANCYLLINNNYCLIVDPADEADFILEQLQRQKLTPLAIIATHGHFDHLMAAGEIQASFKIPLYIFKEDLFLIERLNETAKHFLGYNPSVLPPKNIKFLKDGELKIQPRFNRGQDFKFTIIKTPGHTPGSCSLYFKDEKAIFTGDTLFRQGIGRYDFSYGNKEDLQASLKKIISLPEKTIVYPGHGEKTTIEEEIGYG